MLCDGGYLFRDRGEYLYTGPMAALLAQIGECGAICLLGYYLFLRDEYLEELEEHLEEGNYLV